MRRGEVRRDVGVAEGGAAGWGRRRRCSRRKNRRRRLNTLRKTSSTNCSGLKLAQSVVEEVVCPSSASLLLLPRRPRPIKVVSEPFFPLRRLNNLSRCKRLLEESEFVRSRLEEFVTGSGLRFFDELVLRSVGELDGRVEEVVVVVLYDAPLTPSASASLDEEK
jgi:hypothetical protein